MWTQPALRSACHCLDSCLHASIILHTKELKPAYLLTTGSSHAAVARPCTPDEPVLATLCIWVNTGSRTVQAVASAQTVGEVGASCTQFLRAITLQCMHSGLPGAQALQQHLTRLLDTGVTIARTLADPPVSYRPP